jgi:hypothetical protein
MRTSNGEQNWQRREQPKTRRPAQSAHQRFHRLISPPIRLEGILLSQYARAIVPTNASGSFVGRCTPRRQLLQRSSVNWLVVAFDGTGTLGDLDRVGRLLAVASMRVLAALLRSASRSAMSASIAAMVSWISARALAAHHGGDRCSPHSKSMVVRRIGFILRGRSANPSGPVAGGCLPAPMLSPSCMLLRSGWPH